jgi:hypothetical protein
MIDAGTTMNEIPVLQPPHHSCLLILCQRPICHFCYFYYSYSGPYDYEVVETSDNQTSFAMNSGEFDPARFPLLFTIVSLFFDASFGDEGR